MREFSGRKKTIGVILVGGKSSRMGTDKASLILSGVRLVDHVAKVLTLSGVSDVVVSGEIGGYESIQDMVSNKGPVGGICSSLIRCYEKGFDKAVIFPVDMPLISREVARLLIDSSENSAIDFTFTFFEKNPLPLAVKIDESVVNFCAKTISNLSAGEEISVKNFLKNFASLEIKIPENLVKNLTNTNTPNEWQEAQNEHQDQ